MNPADLLSCDLAPHPRHDALLRRAARLAGECGPWRGVLFRAAEPRYAARVDRLDGVGAKLFGGRWNPAGLACVYGSAAPETAMAEALAAGRHYGLPPESAMPRTFFAFDAEFGRLLDLADGATRRRLGVALRDLMDCDWRAGRGAGRRERRGFPARIRRRRRTALPRP